ncbi:MAG: hypothetical protein ACLQIB_41440 [Isosphaeraceae bacterium]
MDLPNAWKYTSYVLTPRSAAGLVEFWSGSFAPGATARPYPTPRTFKAAHGGGKGELVEVVESTAPADGLVVHRLAQPCDRPLEPELDRFAVGRLLSARAIPRREPVGVKACFDVDASLSCAFQVGRLVVAAGGTLRAVHDLRSLNIRLGMKRREDESAAPEPSCTWSPSAEIDGGEQKGRPYRDFYGYGGFPYAPARPYRDVHGYGGFPYTQLPPYGDVDGCGGFPYGPVPGYGYVDAFTAPPAAPGGQRFDRFRGTAARPPADILSTGTDLAPPRARTISVGWGWETPGDPRTQAFAQIVETRARTFVAVDCRRPPGWFQDFDLSCLLDESAPAAVAPVTFWIGVWVTSGAGHPIDFPTGGSEWILPGRLDDEGVAHYWIAEESAAMGYWRLLSG